MTPVANQSERKTNLDDTKKQLTPRFEKIIAAYATAASAAAGVAILTAPAAEAKVVYTKTNVTITSSYELDLNHDGVPDFDINFCFCLPHGVRLQLGLPVPGNLPREQASSPDAAADLPNGALIGPGQASHPTPQAMAACSWPSPRRMERRHSPTDRGSGLRNAISA